MNHLINGVITGCILILILTVSVSGSPGMPDLTLTGLEFTPSSGDIHTKVQVSCAVQNIGNESASGFYIYYYLSKDLEIDQSDTYLGYNYIFSIGPGETLISQASLTIPSGVRDGSYYIGAVIDPPGWIQEPDKLNNTGVSPVSFIVGKEGSIPVETPMAGPTPEPTPEVEWPDITVVKMGVPEQVSAGSTFPVQTLIYNKGNQSAGGFYISYFLSGSTTISPDDPYLGYSFIAQYFSVPRISYSLVNYTVQMPASVQPGTYYLAAVADSTHVLTKDSAADNVGGVPVTVVVPTPTLIPPTPSDETGAITISSIPNGARITLDGVQYGLSPATIPGLSPGTHMLILDKPGYQQWQGQIDVITGRTVIMTVRLTSTESAVQPKTVTPAPTPIPGAIMIGSTPLGAMVFLDGTAVGVTPYTITNLQPGRYNLVLKQVGYDVWEHNVSVVSYKISQVSAPLTLATPHKSGTITNGTITPEPTMISPEPTPGCEHGTDLIVLSVECEENQIKRDSSFRARATVANAGNVDAGPFYVAYYLSQDNITETSDTFIGSHYYYQLGAGIIGSYIDRVTVPKTTVPGPYYIGAIVDYTHMMDECQNDNNALTNEKPLTII